MHEDTRPVFNVAEVPEVAEREGEQVLRLVL